MVRTLSIDYIAGNCWKCHQQVGQVGNDKTISKGFWDYEESNYICEDCAIELLNKDLAKIED